VSPSILDHNYSYGPILTATVNQSGPGFEMKWFFFKMSRGPAFELAQGTSYW
jgi:hypothetical protein